MRCHRERKTTVKNDIEYIQRELGDVKLAYAEGIERKEQSE